MRCSLVALFALMVAAIPAHASSNGVGVAVVSSTNGSALQSDVTAHLEDWLRKHDHAVVASPLSRDAINTIANCFLIDDLKCASGVVDARSKADAVVFLQRPDLPWDAQAVLAALRGEGFTAADVDALIARLTSLVRDGDAVVFMSNGGFDRAPRRLLAALQAS